MDFDVDNNTVFLKILFGKRSHWLGNYAPIFSLNAFWVNAKTESIYMYLKV